MATPREVALDHYSDRQNFVNATAEAAGSMWSDVDPKAISKTWAAQVPEMAAVVTGAQMGVARLSDDYLDDILDAEDADPFSVADIDPAAFRGASDGRGLLSLLANPAIVALMAIKDGWDIARAMTSGAANLDMLVRTQVSDAGRAADQVALTARPAAKGYVRMAVGKTCARCLLLSGRFYLFNAGFQRHPRCLPAGVVVSGPGRLAATRRRFEGELCVIRTASGQELPVTGNHPVLTDRGWLPANLVQPGDNLVRGVLGEGAQPLVVPDEREMPARIEDLWRADSMLSLRRVPSSAEDFHGDGGHGEVDVVLPDRLLGHDFVAAVGQPASHGRLAARIVPPDPLLGERASDQELVGLAHAAHSVMRRGGLGLASFGRHLARADAAGCGHVSDLDPRVLEAAADHVAAHAVLQAERVLAGARAVGGGDVLDRQNESVSRWDAPPGPLTMESRAGYASAGLDLLERLAGQVALDRVVENRRVEWSGHVHNLTSVEGWYSANSLIVSNCDCIHVPAGDARATKIPGPRQIYDNLSAAERSRAGFSLADQRALAEGADFSQVVNAKRGMYTAGGRRFTTEGTTKRGFASTRLEGRPRLTPDEIFRIAGPDRDEALRLLHQNGYLLEAPVPAPKAARAALVSAPEVEAAATAAAAGKLLIRPEFRAARTIAELEDAVRAEWRVIREDEPFRIDLGDDDTSLATAREHAEGAIRVMETFQEINIHSIVLDDLPGGIYAQAGGGSIEFSRQWSTKEMRRKYLANLRRESGGWSFKGSESPAAVAIHEAAHILDLDTLESDALRRRVEDLVIEMAAGRNAELLIRLQVSGYATTNTTELIAEAFGDAMMNGSRASALSRGIMRLIEDEYEARDLFLAAKDEFPWFAPRAAAPSAPRAAAPFGRQAEPTIRPVLEAARTATAVERVFREEFERITGRSPSMVSFHGSAPATAREHAEGLLRGLERFPEATLDRVVGFDIGTEYASAAGTAIRFSPQWTTPADRKRYLDAVASDARSGWHPRGTGNPVAIAVHEFGHVLDIATLGSVRRKEIQTLLERRAGHRDAAIKAQRDAGDFVDAEDFVAGSGVEGLITREISQYATKNTDELVAEAFSDVVMNGAAASQLSREIFDLIDREYRRGGRRVGTSTVVSASEPAPRAALTTARFEARINAAKTGAAAENLPPVQVRIDASAGSDVGKWRAVEVTGLQGPQSGLLSATTSRVRTSGLANPRLRGETARDIEQRLQLEQVGLGPTPVQAARRAASADREIAALDRAMDQSRLPSDAVVWRVGRPTGVDIPAEGTAVGLEWTDLGFVGTSARRNVAESFAADNRTLMRILAPKDTPAIGIAGGGEAEVLLGRGLRFRVVGESRTAGGARLLDVEVVPAAGTVAPIGAPVAVAQNLSKLTIPKLKEIAAARGIHLPPRARKAEILALLDPPTAGTVTKAQVRADARAAARERNKQIEARGPVEDMLAEVDELLGKSSSTDVMLEHLDALSGVPAADLAALRKAVQTGDRTKIRAAVTRLGNKHGLKAAAPAGKKVAFDPEQHELFGGGEIAAGTQVVVVRRGTTLTIDGETIVFNRARVAVVEAPPKKVTPPKSAPNAYELAPGYKGALARRRHAERDEALMAVADAGSLSVHQAPGTIEVLDVLGSMGYVRRDGSRWRLTDKGQAYADGRKGVASPAPGTAAQITPAEARKMLKFAEVVDAMIHNNALKPGVGDLILEQSARDLGIPTAARDTVIKALLTGSPEQTRAAMAGVFRSAGVKTAAKPGTVVSFDPKIHVAPGRTKVAPGAEVRISEPGLQIEAGGKTVILTKTRVEPPARTTRTLPPEIRRVADLSQTPETGRRALGGGMTGEVHEVTYPGGQVLVRKELGRRAEDVRPVAEQIDAEELAPMVYAALGVRVPATYRATDRVIYMERLEGRTLDEILGWGQFPGPDLLDSDQGRLMGLGDWLVQDTDRNKGGFLVDADGNLWSLDHGFAFERNAEDMVGGRFEFAGHFDGTNNGPTNDMSPADMAEIRTRLDGLRGEFERVGRLTWWRAMMKRMDEAAKGATGTRSRL